MKRALKKPDIFKVWTTKNPYLSKKTQENLAFPLDDATEEELIKMMDTLRYNDGVFEGKGLSLAATQVGLLRNYFVLASGWPNPLKKIEAVINPKILEFSKEKVADFEYCLSVPKYKCLVERSKKVWVEYYNMMGNKKEMVFTDMNARIFQHEIDHLNGIHMLQKSLKLEVNEYYTEFIEKNKNNKNLNLNDLE